ncbi:hypothetical protein [Bradyrhizobium sp. Cp5.3]|uniref:hypothetical protein n=1 Tax=Bradyrhizobium sp. Cp5.3 TaxID=443598 RepID=UPI000686F8DB|nr:hypothetical protein [Bradyrhizobium sp. Cp5.3]
MIELQIEEVARLIWEDQNACEATKRLTELTSELIAARIRPERDDHIAGAIAGFRPAQLHQQSGVYDPEQLLVLGRIFDEAVAALPADMRTDINRTTVAKLIFGRATISEVDLGTLVTLIIAIASAV